MLSAPSADRTLLGLGFEVSGFPGLVEGCLPGAVDAEVDEPASALESASASSAQGEQAVRQAAQSQVRTGLPRSERRAWDSNPR